MKSCKDCAFFVDEVCHKHFLPVNPHGEPCEHFRKCSYNGEERYIEVPGIDEEGNEKTFKVIIGK